MFGGRPGAHLNHAAQVLDLCKSVGRYAAMLATNEASFAIRREHLKAALEAFATRAKKDGAGQDRGAYCIDGKQKSKQKR
jgi:hypothetical protein